MLTKVFLAVAGVLLFVVAFGLFTSRRKYPAPSPATDVFEGVVMWLTIGVGAGCTLVAVYY